MAYFHVLLTFHEAPDKPRCVLADVTEGDLRRQFVKPYQRGTNLFFANEIVDVASIRKVTLIRTERNIDTELKSVQARSQQEIDDFNRPGSVVLISAGRGWSQEDVVEAGEDVTAAFVSGPPGQGGPFSVVAAVLNHPWVAAIGTGLIVAALVWWFGWT